MFSLGDVIVTRLHCCLPGFVPVLALFFVSTIGALAVFFRFFFGLFVAAVFRVPRFFCAATCRFGLSVLVLFAVFSSALQFMYAGEFCGGSSSSSPVLWLRLWPLRFCVL